MHGAGFALMKHFTREYDAQALDLSAAAAWWPIRADNDGDHHHHLDSRRVEGMPSPSSTSAITFNHHHHHCNRRLYATRYNIECQVLLLAVVAY